MTTKEASREDLTGRIAGAIGCERLEPGEAELSLAVIRQLGRGQPVDRALLPSNAYTDGEGWDKLVDLGAELDERGRVIAFGGISLSPTAHRFRVGDRQLYAWCAADTLFLPVLLGESATVESSCPVTASPVRLRVTPEGIESADPAGAVVSFTVPSGEAAGESTCGPASCGSDGAGIAWGELVGAEGAFCGTVHFFESAQAAAPWAAEHPEAFVLPLAEAYTLAREVWAEPLLRTEA